MNISIDTINILAEHEDPVAIEIQHLINCKVFDEIDFEKGKFWLTDSQDPNISYSPNN